MYDITSVREQMITDSGPTVLALSIAVIIIIVSALAGYRKGAISIVYDFISGVILFALVIFISPIVVTMMENNDISSHLTMVPPAVISFIIAFILVVVIRFILVSFSLLPIVKGVNRMLGLFVGTLCGLLMVRILWYVLERL